MGDRQRLAVVVASFTASALAFGMLANAHRMQGDPPSAASAAIGTSSANDVMGSSDSTATGGTGSKREEEIDREVARPDLIAAAFTLCVTSNQLLPNGKACLKKQFQALVAEHGPLPIVNGLGLYREQTGTHCHKSMHLLGQAAYDAIGDLRKAYQVPKAGLCETGYYHGVLQGWALASGPDETVRKFPTVCTDLQINGEAGDCIHGLGHAVAIFLDPDISYAACSQLRGEEQLYCWYGFEMDYSDAVIEQLAAQDPNYMGQPVPPEDRKRAFAEMNSCARLKEYQIRRSCYRFRTIAAYHLLRDTDAAELMDYCAGLGEWTTECVIGTVGENMVWSSSLDTPGGPDPDEICWRAPTDEARLGCLDIIAYSRLLTLTTYESAAAVCEYGRYLKQKCLDDLDEKFRIYIRDQRGTFGTGSSQEQ